MLSSKSTPLSPIRQNARDYKADGLGYLDSLPSFCGIANVQRVGFSVDACANFVARFAAVKKKIVFIAATRMASTPEWELKAALARWMWEDATHFCSLEERLAELRSNKAAIDKVLDFQLGDLMGEILHSPGSLELCVGLFDVLAPAFCQAVREYLAETQPLVDFPTIRLLKNLLAEEEERLEVGKQFVEVLAQRQGGAAIRQEWKAHFEHFLAAAKGILGRAALPVDFTRPVPRAADGYRMSRELARDERFTTIIPKVNPTALKEAPLLNMMWTRSQEMAAAETVAVVLAEWDNLPSEAIVDLSRHCWDEVRHCLFGQAALEGEGFTLTDLESWVGFGVHALDGSPQKAYTHLSLAIEAGTMAYPGGKRGEWEFCRDQAKHPLMTTFQDFDWADEVTHVKYGRKWLIESYYKGNRAEAGKVADATIQERVDFYAQYGVRDWMSNLVDKQKR